MHKADIEAVIRALNEARVEYLVAGGLAVIAHGYTRLTKDINLVIHLERENVMRALHALASLGYRPVVAAVRLEDFADPDKRREWVEQKDARVFQLYSDQHRFAPIDIFIEEPFAFAPAAREAHHDVIAGLAVPFVSLERLIEMKRTAGRLQDLADIDELERVGRERGGGRER
jgi:predicted nucleotidyltransferase